jgi:hypothetical protein
MRLKEGGQAGELLTDDDGVANSVPHYISKIELGQLL